MKTYVNSGQFKKGNIPHNYEGITVNCLQCGKEFSACKYNIKNGMDKFCSRSCSAKHYGKLRMRPDKICKNCGNTFYPSAKSVIFCSSYCCVEYRKAIGGYSKPRKKMTEQQKLDQSNRIKAYYDNGGTSANKGKKLPNRSGENHHFWGKKRPELTGHNNPNWKGGVTFEDSNKHLGNDYTIWRRHVFYRDNYTCQMCGQNNGYLHADHIKSWSDYPELRFDVNNGRTLCRACHYYVTFKRKLPQGNSWGIKLNKRVG